MSPEEGKIDREEAQKKAAEKENIKPIKIKEKNK